MNAHEESRGAVDRMHEMVIERRFMLPADAPERLVENIQEYSAFVDFQSKMLGPSAWYQRLS